MTSPGAVPAHQVPVLCRPMPERKRRVRPTMRMPRGQLVSISWTPPEPPEWVQEPPEPLRYARMGWKKLSDGVNDGTDRLMTGAVLVAAWFALTFQPWAPSMVAVGLWLGALAYGLGVVWLCLTDSPPTRWTTRRAWVATYLLLGLGLLWIVNGAWLQLAGGSLLAAQGFAYRSRTCDGQPKWWTDQRMAEDWLDAGVFGARTPDDLWFRRLVPMTQDEHGTRSLTVVPMSGPRKNARVLNVGADTVQKARPGLERVMGLKVGQLHISHDPDHDAGAITLTVTPPVVRQKVVAAELPDRWDYDQPLFIGKDTLGKAHYRRTWGCHSGFVAMTQKGKTAAALYDVVHAALDPRTSIYLLDFKGDEKDWSALHPLCKRVVTGASLDNARRALQVLEEIERLSESRSTIDPDRAGVVVVVDEWFRLLSLAQRLDVGLARQLDSMLTELMATAASRRIKFISLFQGGTADYINKPMRINIGQRFCGVTEKTDEVRYFMETKPAVLPQAAGQFLFKDDGVGPVLVTHPYLDPKAFAKGCTRALELRREAAGAAQADPLTVAVHGLLAVEPMKPSVLHGLLAEDLRPPTAQALGYALKKMGGVEPTTVGGHRHYRLTPGTVPSQPTEPPTYGGSTVDLSVTEGAPAGQRVAP